MNVDTESSTRYYHVQQLIKKDNASWQSGIASGNADCFSIWKVVHLVHYIYPLKRRDVGKAFKHPFMTQKKKEKLRI